MTPIEALLIFLASHPATRTLPLHEALVFASNVVIVLADPSSLDSPDLTTHEGRVAFAKSNPAIQGLMADNQRISAIKELRNTEAADGFRVGLKEAKDAIDEAYPKPPVEPVQDWWAAEPTPEPTRAPGWCCEECERDSKGLEDWERELLSTPWPDSQDRDEPPF